MRDKWGSAWDGGQAIGGIFVGWYRHGVVLNLHQNLSNFGMRDFEPPLRGNLKIKNQSNRSLKCFEAGFLPPRACTTR